MKQGYLIKFIAFVGALLSYLYAFDASFIIFIESAKKVLDLDFSDKFLLNTIIWLIGFWGILVYLNVGHKAARVTMWSIFIISTFFNFIAHIAYSTNISIGNSDKVVEMISFWDHLDGIEALKFFICSAAIIALAVFIGPLSIGVVSWFPWVLVVISLVSVLFFEDIPALQSAYIVPTVLMHKFMLWMFNYLKESFSK